jgi:hypothetical protein
LECVLHYLLEEQHLEISISNSSEPISSASQMRMLLLVLMLKKVFKTNFREGKNYENQYFEFWIGKRDHYGSSVDNLLAVGLDNAGRDDEYDRTYGSYGYE